MLTEPILLRFGEISSQPRSVETILRAELDRPANADQDPRRDMESVPCEGSGESQISAPPAVERRKRYGLHAAPAELAEQMSLIARWFYSKPREGEIFFRGDAWPYRRILRACGRLLAPPETTQNGMQPSPQPL